MGLTAPVCNSGIVESEFLVLLEVSVLQEKNARMNKKIPVKIKVSLLIMIHFYGSKIKMEG
tara:strand:- start:8067 stop:8249 length:183 start_codon:yes stop_codon:yes gene_type:complete